MADQATPEKPNTRPARPGAGPRSLSLASLREALGEAPPPVPEVPGIKNSGIVYQVEHRECQPLTNSPKRITCTLFYNTKGKDANELSETEVYGQYVTQAAMMDFVRVIGELLSPWKKWDSSHRCLDDREKPRILEINIWAPQMLSLAEMRNHESIKEFEQRWGIDVVVQPDDVFRTHKRMAVFDMDSTLIQQEVIDELADYAGLKEQVAAITARAMNGELDFSESFRERSKLLAGLPADTFEKLKSRVTLTPGAKELCATLNRLGYVLVVLSGGFVPIAEWIQAELGLKYAAANSLVIGPDGKFTGEVQGEIVNAEVKAAKLLSIAKSEGILPSQVIAVGDGANDLKMMAEAGLGVAFNAKPTVQEQAPCKLNSPTLADILYILGFSRDEQAQLLS